MSTRAETARVQMSRRIPHALITNDSCEFTKKSTISLCIELNHLSPRRHRVVVSHAPSQSKFPNVAPKRETFLKFTRLHIRHLPQLGRARSHVHHDEIGFKKIPFVASFRFCSLFTVARAPTRRGVPFEHVSRVSQMSNCPNVQLSE